jgi:hypothetical protein
MKTFLVMADLLEKWEQSSANPRWDLAAFLEPVATAGPWACALVGSAQAGVVGRFRAASWGVRIQTS